jgi:hypothetical protein
MALTLYPKLAPYTKRPLNASDVGQLVERLTVELGNIERAIRDAPLVATRTVTTDTLLSLSDGLCLVDATAGAVTITLPALPAAGGYRLSVKKIDAVNNVTVDGGAANIDGAGTAVITTQYDSVTFIADASQWWIE